MRNKKKTQKTTYEPISHNIYFDGTSYRVRVCQNGEKFSKNFSKKRTAVTYRNQLLSSQ